MRKECRGLAIIILLTLSLGTPALAQSLAMESHNVREEFSLDLPILTQTDCEWDEEGNLIRETAHDLQGRPALNARGFYTAEYTWDSFGNRLTENYYDLQNAPVEADTGYASAVYTYWTDDKENSHILTEDRYAADGSRAEIPGGYSFRRDTYDGGQILSSEYFDAEGNYTRPTGGYARILYEVKEEGAFRTVTKRYLDKDGTLLVGPEGGAVIVTVFRSRLDVFREVAKGYVEEDLVLTPETETEEDADVDWLLLTREIYGKEQNKVLGESRWHRQENTYDARGNLLRTDYTDLEGKPILCSDGYASVSHTYDNKNRTIETCYWGVDQKLIKTLTGHAKVTFEYYGNTKRIHYETYYGADDNRTMTTYGYSKAEHEYNGPDYDHRITYYDTVDEYTMCLNGHARIEIKGAQLPTLEKKLSERWLQYFDRISEERYYGTNMKLIERKNGIAGVVNERNQYGQVIRTVYMDSNWNPVRNEEFQYAVIRYEYKGTDILDRPVIESYYNASDEPVECKNGYYIRTMTYGGPYQSLLLAESFFDSDKKPDTEVSSRAHRIEYSYNGDFLQTGVRYYDKNGKPFAISKGYQSSLREYNKDGRLLWEVTLDEKGNLVNQPGKYAAQVHSYDYTDHETGEKYYSADGSGMLQPEGYASILFSYDEKGNVVSTTYYNSDDELTLVNGRARIVREFDDLHHIIYAEIQGTDFKPVLNRDGYAAYRREYDPDTGLMTRIVYLDTQGKPVLRPVGYAGFEQEYDTNGNLRKLLYFDENGEMVNPPSVGYAWFQRICDESGNTLEEAHYDADGSLIVNRDHYAVLQQEFNENGVLTSVLYLDDNRQPADTTFGYAKREESYDYAGNRVSVAYFDNRLKPVSLPEGGYSSV
ncbi:MAG: hypothetical protein IIY55_01945, partial [Blautia sp.]|nr:hypothetical protein [Blautia sp.]